MLPILTREVVDKHHWIDQDEMLNYFAISQCTPGAIAINVATLIGYREKGALGAAVATFGVVLPSLILIIMIAAFLSQFMMYTWVLHAFAGIRIAVCALIATTVFKLIRQNLKGRIKLLLAALSFVLVAVVGLSPVYIIVASAIFGVLFYGRNQVA